MYDKKEVTEETLKYFNGDELATDVWVNKYCLKDNKGNFHEKTPDDMHKRLAKEFARAEGNYENGLTEEEIYELFKGFKYVIPQGSPMAGIGNDNLLTSLSNCFVVDNPYDSYPGILKTEQQSISIMKRRGGVGLSVHSLRPRSMPTASVSEKSSGVVLFSERYSRATGEVAQDGRRGALMISCRVDHPDILEFIESKVDLNKITDANVSIMITDDFMEAVKGNRDYEVSFRSVKGEFVKTLNARDIWNKIIKAAHKSAEPGVLFWDTILRESPADCYSDVGFKTTSTNPCAEIPLSPGDSCRLMVINLLSYVKHPFTNNAYFDMELFKSHVNKAQRLMDSMIDLELEKIDQITNKIKNDDDPGDLKQVELELWCKIKQMALNGRRTGLGITAEGDMLAAMGMRYASEEAMDFCEHVHQVLAINSYRASIEMARERGAFPVWSFSKEQYNPFLNRVFSVLDGQVFDDYFEHGRRNISNLTVAPAGSVSIMTQTTSGIEPVFLPYYTRRRKTHDKDSAVYTDENGGMWEEYKVFHHGFKKWYDFNYNKIGLYHTGKIEIEDLSEDELEQVYSESPYYNSTSNDINWVDKIKMQGRIQKWVDHSISVTVNVPEKTTVETVNEIYMEAYKNGCKGCTIYRDGSRSGVLVKKQQETVKYNDAPKRPKTLSCDIYTKTVWGKDFTVLIGLLGDKPYEVFAFEQLSQVDFPKEIKKGKVKKVKREHYELTGFRGEKEFTIPNIIELMDEGEGTNTRRYSIQLRHGIKPIFIAEQISKYASITSFDKAIERVLKNYTNGQKTTIMCPNCKQCNLIVQDGCEKCLNCGFQKC